MTTFVLLLISSDYVSVVVSGVLAKSRNLCKLQVRLCLADFDWPHQDILTNTKIIVGPLERLRNVRQPQLVGVFMGRPPHNHMLTVQRPAQLSIHGVTMDRPAPACSVPALPTYSPVLISGMPDFDTYAADWARWISSSSASPVTIESPIRVMFTEFKDFYTKLSIVVPDVTYRSGKHAFLHRARVAREQEDVEDFRHLRNELIQYWYMYTEQEELKKNDLNARLSRMLESDIYPSQEWDKPSGSTRHSSSTTQGTILSVVLSTDTMVKDGIPMTGNPHRLSALSPQWPGCNSQMSTSKSPPFSGSISFTGLSIPSPSFQTLQQMRQQGYSSQQISSYSLMLQDQEYQRQRKMRIQQAQHSISYTSHSAAISAVNTACPSMVVSEDELCGKEGINSTTKNNCFQHVNLTSDWCYDDIDEPGPSTMKRIVNSGLSENPDTKESCVTASDSNTDVMVPYVGKGKGKLGEGVEVICID
jgi:hypothetical protein